LPLGRERQIQRRVDRLEHGGRASR
jgi:hypothetical protein